MLKLIATTEERIDDRTIARRRNNHLTAGWTANQSWKIRGSRPSDEPFEGDAQLVVRGFDQDCAAVVRIGNCVDVVLARGIVDALERLGVSRKEIEVA